MNGKIETSGIGKPQPSGIAASLSSLPENLIFLVPAIALAIIAAILLATPFFVGDEANYVNTFIEFSKTGRPDVYGELVVKPAGMFAITYPILQPLLLLSRQLALPIEFPFRAVTAIFSLLTLYVAYLIFLHLSSSKQTALLSTLAFAIAPNFLFAATTYYPDIFCMFFQLLAFLALLKDETRKGSAIAGLLTGIAFYIKLQQAFVIFAIIVPYLLLRKNNEEGAEKNRQKQALSLLHLKALLAKLRLDYFVFSIFFSAIAFALIILPYYPARLEQFWLLAQTELFTRANLTLDAGLIANNAAIALIATAAWLFIATICAIHAFSLRKSEGFKFEFAELALLLLFLAAMSSFFYTAILFFGASLLIGRTMRSFGNFERGVIAMVLIFAVLQSYFVIDILLHQDARYDYPSQKSLGAFLAGKYPITFVTKIPQMSIWKYYEDYYLPQNSPMLLANMRMAVLPYKFIEEAEPGISGIRAVYYNSRLQRISPEIRLDDKYVVIEQELQPIYSSELGQYEKAAQFGEEPGFIVYVRKQGA
jgi:hypothetical protein